MYGFKLNNMTKIAHQQSKNWWQETGGFGECGIWIEQKVGLNDLEDDFEMELILSEL